MGKLLEALTHAMSPMKSVLECVVSLGSKGVLNKTHVKLNHSDNVTEGIPLFTDCFSNSLTSWRARF